MGAQQAREQTNRQLSKVEQDSYESRKRREAELSITRKEVDRRKAEAEKVERRHARATLLVDNQDQKAQLELQAKQEKQEKILTYDMAFRLIRDATHVTSMDEVVARVMCQQDKQAMLKSQVSDLESQRQRMRTDLKHLNQQFHDMKYSGVQETPSSMLKLASTLSSTSSLTSQPTHKWTNSMNRREVLKSKYPSVGEN